VREKSKFGQETLGKIIIGRCRRRPEGRIILKIIHEKFFVKLELN
jgi:hypothetical protein